MKAKRGRPSKRSPELMQQICTRLAQGQTLRALCAEEGMPHFHTVYEWIGEDSDFSARIARARETGFEAIAEECLLIADEPAECGEAVARNKLRVHTRLQLLSKWSPRYSDKQQVTLSADPSIGEAILAARRRLAAPE